MSWLVFHMLGCLQVDNHDLLDYQAKGFCRFCDPCCSSRLRARPDRGRLSKESGVSLDCV